MSDTNGFIREFRERVEELPSVRQVEFIGSIATGNFVAGSSDLDVFVHGNRIPRQTKKQIRALVRELNDKYEMGLERAPCQHPTPFFIDTRITRALYRLLKDRMELRWFRSMNKKIAPSYGFVWRLQLRR